MPAVASIVTKSRGSVVADTTNNALVITDVQTRIDDVESFVRGLDIRTPQVSIQAKIILVDRTDVEELGLQYDLGSPTQFFNKLVAPDPRPQPVDSTRRRADEPCRPHSPDQTIVDLGRQLALGDRQRRPAGRQPGAQADLLDRDRQLQR